MEAHRTAYFLHRPRRISELSAPHLLAEERSYSIIGEINLRHIDYENFSEDLLADRSFLERYNGPSSVNGEFQCLYVHCWARPDGILVVPKDGFVFQAAAYRP